MADEERKPPAQKSLMTELFGIWEPIVLIGGIVILLFVVAYYRGTLGNLGGQGILQAPLPPVGSGQTYNPSNAPIVGVQGVGTTASTTAATSTATTTPNHR
jgi:hypothetical protein